MSEKIETLAEKVRDKNIMPAPRVCVVTGESFTKYSDMVWLPVYDKEKKAWIDRPTHLSKKGAWLLSKQSPTHPNNTKETTAVVSTVSSQVLDTDLIME